MAKSKEYEVANMKASLEYQIDEHANPSDQDSGHKKIIDYCSLSEEAQIVIKTIFAAPNEFLDITGVKRHFFARWGSHFIVDVVMQEIKHWLRRI